MGTIITTNGLMMLIGKRYADADDIDGVVGDGYGDRRRGRYDDADDRML